MSGASLYYVIVGRYFERAADNAFSIAERAIYMVTGEKNNGVVFKPAYMQGIKDLADFTIHLLYKPVIPPA